MNHPILTQYIDDAIAAQAFPGGQFFVQKGTEILLEAAMGNTTYEVRSPVSETTLYDIASLTKLFTWTLLLQAVEESLVRLTDKVIEFIPELRCQETTLWHLCTHTSGIQDNFHAHYFGPAEEMHRAFLEVRTNPGRDMWYSCANSILAGFVVERVWGKQLDILIKERITDLLGMSSTSFAPTGEVAPTEALEAHGLIHGIPHDEKVRTMGRLIGNAGLFSTATDMQKFLQEWISGDYLLSSDTKKWAWENQLEGGSTPQGLGWLRDRISVRGTRKYPGMVAHAGFTGCQILWWPEHELQMVLLTNRIHPTRQNTAFTPFVEGLIDHLISSS